MAAVTQKQKDEVISNFQFEGTLLSQEPYGSGHINDTFLLEFEIAEMGRLKVILQRMNREVFKKPVELMENVMGVTAYLRERIIENGGDPERETLNVIPTKEGKPYYLDSCGDYWRCYRFITDASCYDQVEKPEDFYESAVAFGNFQRLLAGYGLLLSVRGEKRSRLLLQVERKMIVQVFASVFLTGIVYTIGRKDTWEILTTMQRLWVLILYGLAVCALIQLQYLLELYTDVQYALGIVLVGGALSLFISGSCRGNQEVINSLLFLNLGFARKNGIIAVAQEGISPGLALLTLAAIFLCTIGITLKVFRKRDMI